MVERDEVGELRPHFSFVADCAVYLEMVSDRNDPNFDESEARRLAGSLCAIFTHVDDGDLRSGLVQLSSLGTGYVRSNQSISDRST